jgi:hypothetical protein
LPGPGEPSGPAGTGTGDATVEAEPPGTETGDPAVEAEQTGAAPLSAGRVLRRALLAWGLGHLLLGDRRGWLLLALEAGAIAALVVLTPPLLDGEASGALFLGLAAFLGVWGAQAVDAYREAVARGAVRGGAAAMLALAGPAVLLVGAFWLFAGRSASPAAALEQYVTGWRHDRPDIAARAMVEAPGAESMRLTWAADRDALRNRLVSLAARFGSNELDPDRPFDSLQFAIEPDADDGGAIVHVQLVRRVLVRTQLLGLFPTASQERRVIEEVGTGSIVPVAGPQGLIPGLRAPVWRVERLDIEPPPPSVNP